MKHFGIFLVALAGITGQSNGASVAQSFGQKFSQSAAQALVTGVRSITPKTLYASFIAGSALLGVQMHSRINNYIKWKMKDLEEISKEDPVIDCPVKQKIMRTFAEQGYELFFVKQYNPWGDPGNAGVIRHGKKVAFFVFGKSDQDNFLTSPGLADARDGIIEHELGHVVNGDTAGGVLASSIAASALLAVTGCATIAAASYNPSVLIEKLMPFSSSIIKKTAGVTARFCAGCTAGVVAGGTGAIAVQLGVMAHSRYKEKRADYHAVAQAQAQNKPEMLEGMARFFEKMAKKQGMAQFFERMAKKYGITEKKTWKKWWYEKMNQTHPCCCDRHRYLMKEAGKIRAKQTEAQEKRVAVAAAA